MKPAKEEAHHTTVTANMRNLDDITFINMSDSHQNFKKQFHIKKLLENRSLDHEDNTTPGAKNSLFSANHSNELISESVISQSPTISQSPKTPTTLTPRSGSEMGSVLGDSDSSSRNAFASSQSQAQEVLKKAMRTLEYELTREDRYQQFLIIKPVLFKSISEYENQVLAKKLSLSEDRLRYHIYLLRQRFRRLFQLEARKAISAQAHKDKEVHELMELISNDHSKNSFEHKCFQLLF